METGGGVSSNGKSHAIPPDELRERAKEVVPKAERWRYATWLGDRTGYAPNSWSAMCGGHVRVTEKAVRQIEKLERGEVVLETHGNGRPAPKDVRLNNPVVRSAIMERIELLRDRVKAFRREVRTDASAIVRQAGELEDTLTAMLGDDGGRR